MELWKDIIASKNITLIKDAWHSIPEEDLAKYFIMLPRDTQVDMLSDLEAENQELLITQLANRGIHSILEYMEPDDLVELFRNIREEVRDSVWHKLSEQTRRVVQFLLRFDHDDAAGIMTPKYVAIKADTTVEKTIKFIRANIDNVETIYYIYVVDAIGRLQGVVSLRDLIKRKDTMQIKEFMVSMVYSVQENTDQEEVAKLLKEHSLLAVPVVDAFNRLQGIITVDDAIDIIDEEHEEDVLHLNAIGAQTSTYLQSSVFRQFQTRIPWLVFLLLAGTLTSNVISIFMHSFTVAAYLIWFIPVVTSTGGNIATQSSTLMIRGLARNELDFKNFWAVMFKEGVVSLLMGLCLAAVMIARGVFFPPQVRLMEAATISLSLLFVVLFSSVIGALFPLVLSKFKVDPTVVATPFIATCIDLLGLSVYFGVTQFLL